MCRNGQNANRGTYSGFFLHFCADMTKQVLLSMAYLPPIQWVAHLATADEVWVEACENYQKNSFRNRAHICTPTGVHLLSVPLVSGKHAQMPMRAVRIAYDEPWQSLHWATLQSAYGKSPFWVHYAHDFEPIFRQKFEYLWDWNFALLSLIIKLLRLDTQVLLTTQYDKITLPEMVDLRGVVAHKTAVLDLQFRPIRYPQVFEEHTGFVENCSILDLLCCAGNQSYDILRRSICY